MAEEINDMLVRLQIEAGASAEIIAKLSAQLESTARGGGEYKKAMEESAAAMVAMSKMTKKSGAEFNRLKQILTDSTKVVMDHENSIKSLADSVEKATAKGASGWSKYTSMAKKSFQALSYGHKVTTQFNDAFGVQRITFANSLKSVQAYNQGLYDLTRSQKILGKGGGDIQKSLKMFEKNTTLSTNEALNFSNAISGLYVGIKPAASEMAKFAESIQNSFGPNPEKTLQVGQELMNIQKQFPALYDNIRFSHDSMISAMISGNADLLSSSNAVGAGNVFTATAMGADFSQIETMIQYQTPVDAEDKDKLDLNTKVDTAAKESKNAVLAVGQHGEEAFKSMADAMATTYGWLGKHTTAAIGLAAALTSVAAAQSLMGFGGAMGGMKALKGMKGGLNSMGKSGGIFNGSRGMFGAAAKAAPSAAGSIGRTASLGLGGAVPAAKSSVGLGARVAAGGTGAALGTVAAVAGAGAAGWGAGRLIDKHAMKLGGSDKALSDTKGVQMASAVAGGPITMLIAALDKMKESKTAAGSAEGSSNLEKAMQKKHGTVYEEKAKAAGLDKMGGKEKEQAVLKIAQELRKEALLYGNVKGKTVKQVKEERTEANNLLMEYIKISKNNEARLAIQNKFTQALSSQVSISKEFLTVNQANLTALGKSAKAAAEIAKKEYADAGKGYSGKMQEVFDMPDVDLGVKFTANMSADQLLDELDKGIPKLIAAVSKKKEEIDKQISDGAITSEEGTKQKAALDGQVEGAKSARTVMTEKKAAKVAGEGDALKAQNTEMTTGASVQKEMLDIASQRVQMEKEIYEAAHFGMGVSVELLQKQIALEKKKHANAQQAQSDLVKAAVEQTGMEEKLVKSVVSGKISKEQALNMTKKQFKTDGERVAAELQLGNAYKEANKWKMEELGANKKILEATKQVREGYLMAQAAMIFGAGEFSDMISDGEHTGITQMHDIVQKGGGSLDTLMLGGTGGTREEGKAAGREKVAYELVGTKDGKGGGMRIGRTKEEFAKGAAQLGIDSEGKEEQLDNMVKNAEGTVGASAAGRPGQSAAIMEANINADAHLGEEEAAKELTRKFREDNKLTEVVAGVGDRGLASRAGEGEAVGESVASRKNRGDIAISGAEGSMGGGITDKELEANKANISADNSINDGASITQSADLGGVELKISIDKEGVPFVKTVENNSRAIVSLEGALTDGPH